MMAAKARAEMLAGIGAIGQRRKARQEALERAEEDARMALAHERQNASAAGQSRFQCCLTGPQGRIHTATRKLCQAAAGRSG